MQKPIGYISRKLSILILIILFLASLTGCPALKRKFTRKKKEVPRISLYRPVREYKKKPASELYKKHFVFWRSWQSELIRVLGKNRKKDIRCIDEIIANLEDIKRFLVKEKQLELEPHIERLVAVREKIMARHLSKYNRDYIMRVLKREEMAIKRAFAYSKVKDFLKEQFHDEEEAEDR